MGLQVPYCVDSEVQKEGIVRPTEEISGEVIRALAQQKESKIWEGHLMCGHVHVLVSIPPKYAVAQVVGFIKGKSSIYIARNF